MNDIQTGINLFVDSSSALGYDVIMLNLIYY